MENSKHSIIADSAGGGKEGPALRRWIGVMTREEGEGEGWVYLVYLVWKTDQHRHKRVNEQTAAEYIILL